MLAMDSTTTSEDDRCGRRGGTDRRVRTAPIAHAERRKSERRSGTDRRELDR